ncbi:glycerol-3-phosphate acyltransferase 9 [Pelomyxa schiedti]|nr:glycerol-3-phosphate acyltransferase 9 [Pelomyxa schiedti]
MLSHLKEASDNFNVGVLVIHIDRLKPYLDSELRVKVAKEEQKLVAPSELVPGVHRCGMFVSPREESEDFPLIANWPFFAQISMMNGETHVSTESSGIGTDIEGKSDPPPSVVVGSTVAVAVAVAAAATTTTTTATATASVSIPHPARPGSPHALENGGVPHPPTRATSPSGSDETQLDTLDMDYTSLPNNPSQDYRTKLQRFIEHDMLRKLDKSQQPKAFNLLDIAPMVRNGMEKIVEDEFTNCFQPNKTRPWNWNAYLFPAWVVGILFRYALLIPGRTCWLIFCTLLYIPAFAFVQLAIKNSETKMSLQRSLARLYCGAWVSSFTGVVKYHGIKPRKAPNQVFVANHTTLIDICILQQNMSYAIIGQKHTGVVGFFQDYPLACLGCVWFERKYANDRAYLQRRLKEHLAERKNNPLLIFPEGTCVNNEYCIMFKKGAFELGATVCPIAIKYNKLFCDPFWDSRNQSFLRHVFNMMRSWALVCDVWYLEPQRLQPGETPTQFANRVKALIANKAGLANVEWDGYLKYFKPSPRFLEEKQRLYALKLMDLMNTRTLSLHTPTLLSTPTSTNNTEEEPISHPPPKSSSPNSQ